MGSEVPSERKTRVLVNARYRSRVLLSLFESGFGGRRASASHRRYSDGPSGLKTQLGLPASGGPVSIGAYGRGDWGEPIHLSLGLVTVQVQIHR